MDIVVLANRYKVHHFRSLEERFQGRFVYEGSYDPQRILEHGPLLVVCFDEHYCELANAIATLKEKGVATLQVMDGILEWRRTWDYRRNGEPVDGVVLPLNQPALSDKIACLGWRDARILESWGNAGKCEVVGAPRLDHLVARRMSGGIKPRRPATRRPRLLVMTAKTPGFSPEQMAVTRRSLADLRDVLQRFDELDVIWRLTAGLDRELGIRNRLSDLTGTELHTLLEEVDAVITTPSTSMLEGMLLERPVALLDYHNTPHLFEAAWSITCESQMEPVLRELLDPPRPRWDYQEFLLHEQLACYSPASDRLATLIERMLEIRASSPEGEVSFPDGLLQVEGAAGGRPAPLGRLTMYYPSFPVPDDMEQREMRMELAAARGTIQILYTKVRHLEGRLRSIPGYRMARAVRRALRRLT